MSDPMSPSVREAWSKYRLASARYEGALAGHGDLDKARKWVGESEDALVAALTAEVEAKYQPLVKAHREWVEARKGWERVWTERIGFPERAQLRERLDNAEEALYALASLSGGDQ